MGRRKFVQQRLPRRKFPRGQGSHCKIQSESGKENFQGFSQHGRRIIGQKRAERRHGKRNSRSLSGNHTPGNIGHDQARTKVDQTLHQHHSLEIADAKPKKYASQKSRISRES